MKTCCCRCVVNASGVGICLALGGVATYGAFTGGAQWWSLSSVVMATWSLLLVALFVVGAIVYVLPMHWAGLWLALVGAGSFAALIGAAIRMGNLDPKMVRYEMAPWGLITSVVIACALVGTGLGKGLVRPTDTSPLRYFLRGLPAIVVLPAAVWLSPTSSASSYEWYALAPASMCIAGWSVVFALWSAHFR